MAEGHEACMSPGAPILRSPPPRPQECAGAEAGSSRQVPKSARTQDGRSGPSFPL